MNTGASSSTLRPYWFVGLTGHRHLDNPDAVAKVLTDLLIALQAEVRGGLVGVSSIAIGADTLFARAILSLSLPWRALLPSPPSEFRHDFDEKDWRAAEQLLAQAIEVDVRAMPSIKDEAYLECGMDTVDQSDVLIAVWDEKPARGTGGTGEIVAYARSLKKPLIILNPETLTARREGFGEHPFSDPEIEYLNQLPGGDAVAPAAAGAVPANFLQFFAKVDHMAARVAPNFRRWVASAIVMNACATVLAAATIVFALRLPVLDASVFIMTGGAMGAVIYLKFQKIHAKWIHCRVAAEICRTAIVTWELPVLVLPELANQAGRFSRLKTCIRMMHLCSRPKVEPGLDYLQATIYCQAARRPIALSSAPLDQAGYDASQAHFAVLGLFGIGHGARHPGRYFWHGRSPSRGRAHREPLPPSGSPVHWGLCPGVDLRLRSQSPIGALPGNGGFPAGGAASRPPLAKACGPCSEPLNAWSGFSRQRSPSGTPSARSPDTAN